MHLAGLGEDASPARRRSGTSMVRGAQADHAQPPWRARVRRSCQKKNGLPMSAVSTPSGTSAGAATVRAARSASTRIVAPSSAEAGSSSRWPGAGDHADEVGDDEADEEDLAADGDRRGGEHARRS